MREMEKIEEKMKEKRAALCNGEGKGNEGERWKFVKGKKNEEKWKCVRVGLTRFNKMPCFG